MDLSKGLAPKSSGMKRFVSEYARTSGVKQSFLGHARIWGAHLFLNSQPYLKIKSGVFIRGGVERCSYFGMSIGASLGLARGNNNRGTAVFVSKLEHIDERPVAEASKWVEGLLKLASVKLRVLGIAGCNIRRG